MATSAGAPTTGEDGAAGGRAAAPVAGPLPTAPTSAAVPGHDAAAHGMMTPARTFASQAAVAVPQESYDSSEELASQAAVAAPQESYDSSEELASQAAAVAPQVSFDFAGGRFAEDHDWNADQSTQGDAFVDALQKAGDRQRARLPQPTEQQAASRPLYHSWTDGGTPVKQNFTATSFDLKTGKHVRDQEAGDRTWGFELADAPGYKEIPYDAREDLDYLQRRYENEQMVHTRARFKALVAKAQLAGDGRPRAAAHPVPPQGETVHVPEVGEELISAAQAARPVGNNHGLVQARHIVQGDVSIEAQDAVLRWIRGLTEALSEEQTNGKLNLFQAGKAGNYGKDEVDRRFQKGGSTEHLRPLVEILSKPRGAENAAVATVHAVLAQFCSEQFLLDDPDAGRRRLKQCSDDVPRVEEGVVDEKESVHLKFVTAALGIGRALQAQANFADLHERVISTRNSIEVHGIPGVVDPETGRWTPTRHDVASIACMVNGAAEKAWKKSC